MDVKNNYSDPCYSRLRRCAMSENRSAIPKEAQIRAMLDHTAHALLEQHGFDAEAVADTQRSLDVTRSDLLEYLRSHPGEADRYFAAHSGYKPWHEAIMLERHGVQYSISMNDHGARRDTDVFPSLEQAVAFHVLAV